MLQIIIQNEKNQLSKMVPKIHNPKTRLVWRQSIQSIYSINKNANDFIQDHIDKINRFKAYIIQYIQDKNVTNPMMQRIILDVIMSIESETQLLITTFQEQNPFRIYLQQTI